MRIGIEVTASSVSNSSSSVTFTWKVYTQNQYQYRDNGQTIEWSGALSGTTSYDNHQGAGTTTLRSTRTSTYNYPANSYGTSPGNQSVTVRIGYSYNGSHPQVTATIAIPARPIAAPNTPTMGATYRVSDSRGTVNWTNNSSAARPYSTITITRRFSWNDGFTTVATVPGSSTSWVDNGLRANAQVQYQIRANNSAGSSGWSGFSTTYYTTPGTPTGVNASLSGSTIVVRWTNNVNYSPHYGVWIERSNAGGAWSVVASNLASGTTQWTDTSPPAGSNQYRVRAKAIDTTYNTGPYSSYGTSNTVSTMVPPLAPTLLYPNGLDRDGHLLFGMFWQHNPGGDNAPQTRFQIRYSSNGGSTWTIIGPITSSSSTYEMPPDTLVNGLTYVWQVSTKGTHASFGPWSTSATIPTSTTPTVTMTGPPALITVLPVVAEWTFNQDEGLPQAGWEGRLLSDDGTVLEAGSGTTEQAWTLTYPVEDGQTYTVQVRARANTIWSDPNTGVGWAETTFTVDLLPPANVTITPNVDDCSGTISLLLHADDPVEGVTAAVAFVDVQRRIDGGDWVTLIAGVELDPNRTVVDDKPTLNGMNEYRLIVTSISPSTAIMPDPPLQVPLTGFSRTARYGFLHWGPGLQTIERASCDPQISEQGGRARAAEPVKGREDPMLLVGTQRSRTVSVAFTVGRPGCPPTTPGDCPDPDSTAVDFLLAGRNATVALWRDWRGRRIYGMLSDVSTSDVEGSTTMSTVSFTITQTFYVEGVTPLGDPTAVGEGGAGG